MDSCHTSTNLSSDHEISTLLETKEEDSTLLKENATLKAFNTTYFYVHVNIRLWQTVPPALLIFGTFGNVMIVVVMRGLRASQSTACLSVYFTALAVSDQFFLLTAVLWFWIYMVFTWPPSFFRYDLLCTIPWFVWYTCCLSSAWFLVVMTYQRVTSVVTPHRVGVLCTVGRAKIIIAVIAVIACVLNHHFLYTFSYWPFYIECRSREKYQDFIDLFTWVDLWLSSLIPFFLLGIGNAVLIWHVIKSVQFSRQMRGSLNQQATSGRSNKTTSPMTTTLILISAAFLLFTLPTCIFDAYLRMVDLEDANREFLSKLYLMETITLFLWFGNSACNFYLYLLSGSKFRQETKRCLLGWKISVSK
ncbi:hypothetical protein ACOMHN_033400 [Nucella lapillus]